MPRERTLELAAEVGRLTRECDRLAAAMARTRALLREIEWQPGGLCACCDKRTHTDTCALAALLREDA